MMRLAQLALVMASTLTIASPAYALQEQQQSMTVEQISDKITSLQNEYDNYTQTVQRLKDEAEQLEQKLASLRERNQTLEKQRQTALQEMNNRYQQLVDDPTIDIAGAQQAYKEAVMAHQQNKKDIATQIQLTNSKKLRKRESAVTHCSMKSRR